jgi:hypothetical protein
VRCAEGSGDFLTASPPGEKTSARQDQARQSSTGNGTGNRDPNLDISDLGKKTFYVGIDLDGYTSRKPTKPKECCVAKAEERWFYETSGTEDDITLDHATKVEKKTRSTRSESRPPNSYG